jgi:hypothetical protein
MPDPKGATATDSRPPEARGHPQAGANLLFLREEEIRAAQDLLFFAYRDFTNAADVILEELELGRAHHRALHFIGRNPGIAVGDLLALLRITKQSLARVLTTLVDSGYRPPPAAADPDRHWPGAGTPPVRTPARTAGDGLSRGRGQRGGGVSTGDARHHGRGGARLSRPRRGAGARAADAAGLSRWAPWSRTR